MQRLYTGLFWLRRRRPHSDLEAAGSLARDLEAVGYTTWWDTSLLPGEEFQVEIMRELDTARAVIVIWTESSVNSRWVSAEALRADAQNKLITVHDAGLARISHQRRDPRVLVYAEPLKAGAGARIDPVDVCCR